MFETRFVGLELVWYASSNCKWNGSI